MTALFIGLMSGTSMDGIDAVVLDVGKQKALACHFMPYPKPLRQRIASLASGELDSVQVMAELDRELAMLYAQAVKQLLSISGLASSDITAIGCHGQTIRHHVLGAGCHYTLQIGDPNTLAAETGITVVADFRRADLARGGQGAPFAPLYHQQLFLSKSTPDLVVVNIGGVANISYLNANHQACGFDVGPGNTLLDLWAQKYLDKPFDDQGEWASIGHCQSALLDALLDDPYFSLQAPKSIAKEYFDLNWLFVRTEAFRFSPEDVQATLLEFSAKVIHHAIVTHNITCSRLIVCGGGSKNLALLNRLAHYIPKVMVSDSLGFNSDYIEAMMFGWLASLTLKRQAVVTHAITGALSAPILGGVYYT